MFELPDRPVRVSQLGSELAPLNLPGLTGVARLSRRKDALGIWQPSAPYILIKCGTLTAAQETAVRDIVQAHVPAPEPPPPPPPDPILAEIDALVLPVAVKDVLRKLAEF